MNLMISTLAIGIGATVMMDLWGITRKVLLKQKAPDYGMVGRWLGHMVNGQFRHAAIAKSPPVRGERVIGWTAHYLTGIVFASLLTAPWNGQWAQSPSLLPALVVGLGTLIAPFLLMQPGMGVGIAASRTPDPTAARWQSVGNHLAFGVGLYLSALLVQQVFPAQFAP